MSTARTHTPVALVTGGSGGLGRDMAHRLADYGRDVVVTYRNNAESAEQLVSDLQAKGRKAAALQLDLTDFDKYGDFEERLRQTLSDSFGVDELDYLVNNAGIGAHAMIGQTSEETFDQLFNIQFKGTFMLTQRLLGLLRDGGAIVNVSTGLARFAIPGYAAYASAKGAVETFTHYLAKELGSRGIRANSVAPGAIDNEFNADALEHNPGMRERLSSVTAMGRMGKSSDIGGVVAFLCSDDAGWVTAQRIEASGGMFL